MKGVKCHIKSLLSNPRTHVAAQSASRNIIPLDPQNLQLAEATDDSGPEIAASSSALSIVGGSAVPGGDRGAGAGSIG